MGNNFNISGVWRSISDLWLPIALAAVGIILVVFFVGFLVKKKWIGVIVTAVVAALLAGGGFIYRLPHSIIDINAKEVSKISVSDIEVTDTETIEDILNDLNDAEYKRTLPSGIGGRQVEGTTEQ